MGLEFYLNALIDALKISMPYTVKISIIVLITMFIVNYIMNTGVMKKVSDLLSPILKRLKINPLSISSILACFFSPTVGYSILAAGLKENKINE